MEIRSALLNSTTTRNTLMPDATSIPEINQALGAIDQIGKVYDALRHVHGTVNPKETVEARAMRYEKQFVASITHARGMATQAAEKLDNLAQTIRARALAEAGLAAAPASAQEIRAALRSLSQKERDKAIADAFKRGDAEVLASIYGSNRVTWGGASQPLEAQFEQYIDKAAPEAVRQRDALEQTMQGLEMAVDTFVRSAQKWREPAAAERGFEQEADYGKAEAELKAALGVTG